MVSGTLGTAESLAFGSVPLVKRLRSIIRAVLVKAVDGLKEVSPKGLRFCQVWFALFYPHFLPCTRCIEVGASVASRGAAQTLVIPSRPRIRHVPERLFAVTKLVVAPVT